MRVVELRRRRPEDGRVERLARIHVPRTGGAAVVEALDPKDQAWIDMLLSQGGVVDARGRELTAADGDAYVRALPHSFRGSRLWAEEVAEKSRGA